ncbi:hypothetical protein ABG067_004467 [Albugo candida]
MSGYRLTCIGSLVAISSLLWGYTFTVLNVCILPNAIGSILNSLRLETEEQERATGLVLVGALVAAFSTGDLAERISLRRLILLNNVFFVIGALLCALANSKMELFSGRLCIGIACGIVTNTVPILLSEIAPICSRGKLTSYHQLCVTIGILATSCFGWFFIKHIPDGWRYLNLLIVVPAIIQCSCIRWFPESPLWLYKHRGRDAAQLMLKQLRGQEKTDESIKAELEEMAQQIELQKKQRMASIQDLWMHLSIILTGSALITFQAITGINTVMLYSAKLFEIAGLADPFMANVTANLVNVLATIISLQIVDTYGRRKLLIFGSALMTAALMCLSGSLLYLDNNTRLQGQITVLCVLFFIAGFAVGLGVVVWVYLTDITPVEIRSRAFSIYMGVGYIWNIIVASYTLSAIHFLGTGDNPEKDGLAKLCLVFGGLSLSCVIFVLYCVHDTQKADVVAKEAWQKEEDEVDILLPPSKPMTAL